MHLPRPNEPNPTGLAGIMESFCPLYYPDMRAALEALCDRKFGSGGPFNANTPGSWKNSAKVRSKEFFSFSMPPAKNIINWSDEPAECGFYLYHTYILVFRFIFFVPQRAKLKLK